LLTDCQQRLPGRLHDTLVRHVEELENDPESAPALGAVNRTLGRLADDPFNPRLGTTAFMTEEYGGVSATPVRFDDWYILWQRGPEPRTIEIVLVHQLRPVTAEQAKGAAVPTDVATETEAAEDAADAAAAEAALAEPGEDVPASAVWAELGWPTTSDQPRAMGCDSG